MNYYETLGIYCLTSSRLDVDTLSLRRQLKEFIEMKMVDFLASDDLSGDSSSDDDVIAVVCELAFAPPVALGPQLNLEDLSSLECKELFR